MNVEKSGTLSCSSFISVLGILKGKKTCLENVERKSKEIIYFLCLRFFYSSSSLFICYQVIDFKSHRSSPKMFALRYNFKLL